MNDRITNSPPNYPTIKRPIERGPNAISLEVKPGYRPQASDISPETDIFEFTLLRQRSNGDRVQMSAVLTQGARQLCICGLRQTHSSLSAPEFAQTIAKILLPKVLNQGTIEAEFQKKSIKVPRLKCA